MRRIYFAPRQLIIASLVTSHFLSCGSSKKSIQEPPHESAPPQSNSPGAPTPPGTSAQSPAVVGTAIQDKRSSTDVPNLSNEPDISSLIQSLSGDQSVGSNMACLNILIMSPQDIEWHSVTNSDSSELRQFYCGIDETTLGHYFHDKVSRSNTASDNLGIDLALPKISLPVDVKLNMSTTRGNAYSQDMANQDAQIYKKNICTNTESSQDHGRTEQIFRKFASTVTLDKYNQCVAQKQHGFICDISDANNTVTVTMKWEPVEMVSRHLPRLALTFATIDNLKPLSAELPKIIGLGTGQAVAFTRLDSEKSSTLQIIGHDSGNTVTLSCSRVIPPIMKSKDKKNGTRKIWAQHQQCGRPIAKTQDIMALTDEPDKNRPEEKIIHGAVHPEPIHGEIGCDDLGQRLAGRRLCLAKGLVFVSEDIRPHTCFVKEGLFSHWSEAFDVYAICRDPDTKEVFYPHSVQVKKKIGEDRKEVTPACQIDESLPGIREISESLAKIINDPSNFEGLSIN